jgi:cytoskeletal protein CcmA (bactofilin family)
MFSKGETKKGEDAGVQDRPRPSAGSSSKASVPSIISADLKVEGNIICDGDIQVDGRVEGDVRSRNLTIGEHGAVVGEVAADKVQISGTVEGRISAKTVNLAKSARIIGDIAHDSLSMEAGAYLEGRVSRLDGTPVSKPATTAAPATGGAKPGGGAGGASSSS